MTVIGRVDPPPIADAALSARRWEGVIARLDMMLYLHERIAGRRLVPLHRRVLLAVLTELAGTDPELAHYLVDRPPASIMEPTHVLKQFALSRGWTPDRLKQTGWHDGTCDRLDGSCFVHSAAVAVLGNQAELRRRVWRGQVAVLFPFIEECRIRIIERVRSYIRLPLETQFGRIERAEDLEVSHLRQTLRGCHIPSKTWKLLNRIVQMRHSLAHLEPVPLATLMATDELDPDD